VTAAGQCTVGVMIDAPAGTWGNVDDIEFMREDGTSGGAN
jgi:arabinogalactan endo-1,4-beta-galactosidase